jgi:hypothetical protein
MANHSYVELNRAMASFEEADQLIKSVVRDIWGERLQVEYRPGWSEHEHTWLILIPGSQASAQQAKVYMTAPGEPFGFTAYLSKKLDCWEFRHPFVHWEHWAQDLVQHTIAKTLGVKTLDNDGPTKVNPDELRKTYRAYITRNFQEPYTAEDQAWFDNLLARAPEGFRE